MPASKPLKQSLLNSIPTTNGVKITNAPGAIIIFREALVLIATHLSVSIG
jgi:hypothetical protein